MLVQFYYVLLFYQSALGDCSRGTNYIPSSQERARFWGLFFWLGRSADVSQPPELGNGDTIWDHPRYCYFHRTPIGGHNNEIAKNNNCKKKNVAHLCSFHIASSALHVVFGIQTWSAAISGSQWMRIGFFRLAVSASMKWENPSIVPELCGFEDLTFYPYPDRLET